jgi:hypothetical protein
MLVALIVELLCHNPSKNIPFLKNDVWDIVLRPKGKSAVTFKWIYKIKHAADGSVEKYKARFVARRFSRVEGNRL